MQHDRLLLRRQKEIQEKLALILQKEGKHSPFSDMTITRVRLSSSMASAKVYYLLLQGKKIVFEGQLKSKALFLQSYLAKNLGYKNAPQLEFIFDTGYEHAARIDSLFEEVRKEAAALADKEEGVLPEKTE